MTDKQKELVEMAERAASLTDAFLTHATQAVSQYDSLCRNMAAEILCLRHALNRCAHHSDLKILHEQTRCSVCLTNELRAKIEYGAMVEGDYLRVCGELKDLRDVIRSHRDVKGDDRCWMDDADLYAALPEGYTPPARDTSVELANCERYIASRQNPATVYISPERRIETLEEQVGEAFGIVQSIMGIDLTGDDPDDLVSVLRTLQQRLDRVIKTLDTVRELQLLKIDVNALNDALDLGKV
jgi:hypothetical protein